MADKTLDQFTAASSKPGLLSILLMRDEDYSSPDTRSVTLLQLIEAIQGGMTVKSMAVANPASLTPSKGDTYVVAASAAGGWVGQENKIAVWNGSSWQFVTATEGWEVYDQNADQHMIYTGAAWVQRTAASLSYSGVLTATDVAAALDELAGSPRTFSLQINAFASGAAVTVGNGTVGMVVPAFMSGMNVTDVVASVHDKGITGTTDIQIRRRRDGVDADVLTTKVTLGDEFSVSDEEVDTGNDDLATGDILYVDVDTVHSGTPPNGLTVVITAQKP